MSDGKPVQGSVYFYAPSKIAPACFALAFLASGCVHLWQCIRYKSFKVTGLHPFCCLMFTVGFALREYGAFDYENLNVYLASTICIYSAPPILELANYHVLGRILYYVPYFAPLHPGRTLTTFGTLSFFVEVMNAIGVSYIANPRISPKLQKLGHILMKASLIVQLAVISLFCVIAGLFHRKCLRAGLKTRNVQGPLLTMYISMALIFVRTIYRIIEHFGVSAIPADRPKDWDPMSLSPLVRYEWYFYVFEATLMLINTVLWNVCHPRRYLPEDYHVYLAQDGRTELHGPGWKDEQPWIMTFIDPCGITAAFMQKGKKVKNERPFWETNGFENVPLVKQGQSDTV